MLAGTIDDAMIGYAVAITENAGRRQLTARLTDVYVELKRGASG